jgi:hypothetical protein
MNANRQNRIYAQNITYSGHTCGTINGTLEELHIEKKGQLLNTIEQLNFSKKISKCAIHLQTHTIPYFIQP